MPYTMDMSAGARHGFSVTPSDSTDTPFDFRGIVCSTAGTVTITTLGYNGVPPADVNVYVAAGIPFPLAGTRIKATGTTATGIVALL